MVLYAARGLFPFPLQDHAADFCRAANRLHRRMASGPISQFPIRPFLGRNPVRARRTFEIRTRPNLGCPTPGYVEIHRPLVTVNQALFLVTGQRDMATGISKNTVYQAFASGGFTTWLQLTPPPSYDSSCHSRP